MDSITPFSDRNYLRTGITGIVQEDSVKTVKNTHLSSVFLYRERERERERESINKKLTCFVGAHTGPGVSDDGEEFSPFLSPAHNNPAEEEA